MGKKTKIEWADDTFNPWMGCNPVSEGCRNCYAEKINHRMGFVEGWEATTPRARTGRAYWHQPFNWEANPVPAPDTPAGTRPRRVFAGSMCDILDAAAPIEWFSDFLKLVMQTPGLNWLLLTKRPENFFERVFNALTGPRLKMHTPEFSKWLQNWYDGHPPENVWFGTTVENQSMANQRVPLLLKIPARIRFLSCEPLLTRIRYDMKHSACGYDCTHLEGHNGHKPLGGIHWIIAGGETGPGARPMHPHWPGALSTYCACADIPFFFKQWGEYGPLCTVDDYRANATEFEPEHASRAVIMQRNGLHIPWEENKRANPEDWVMFRCGKKAAAGFFAGAFFRAGFFLAAMAAFRNQLNAIAEKSKGE